MKRLVSILMVLTIAVMSLVVPVNVSAASVDVTSTGNYVPPRKDYGYDTPYITWINVGNGRGCPNRIDVQFRSVSGLNYYRIFCKIVDQRTGEVIKDWRGMRNIHDGGKWNPTTYIYFDNDWFSNVDIRGYYSDARHSFVNNRWVRIYVTVRGISYPDGEFLTGYYDWGDTFYWEGITESIFCPTITKVEKNTTGTDVEMKIRTGYPLASEIKYYRVYCSKNGRWVSLGDYYIGNDYTDGPSGRTAWVNVRYTNDLHNCDTFRNGTCLLTVRGLDKNRQWCTPFMYHYLWTNYVKYR